MTVEKYDLRNRISRDQRQSEIGQWLGLGSELLSLAGDVRYLAKTS